MAPCLGNGNGGIGPFGTGGDTHTHPHGPKSSNFLKGSKARRQRQLLFERHRLLEIRQSAFLITDVWWPHALAGKRARPALDPG